MAPFLGPNGKGPELEGAKWQNSQKNLLILKSKIPNPEIRKSISLTEIDCDYSHLTEVVLARSFKKFFSLLPLHEITDISCNLS